MYLCESVNNPQKKVVAIAKMYDFPQAFNILDKNILILKQMEDLEVEPWYECNLGEILRKYLSCI